MEQTFYKARNTLIEMMKDREYQHPDGLDSFNMQIEEFKELFKNSNSINKYGTRPVDLDMTGITTRDGVPVYVRVLNAEIKDAKTFKIFDTNKAERSDFIPVAMYYNNEVLDEKDLNEFLEKVHVIIVYQAPLKRDQRYDITLETTFIEHPNVEAFPVHKLTFNVTKHMYVSKHRLLSESERETVYEKFNASKQMFTKICLDDPVNMYYNGRPGDMYEITPKQAAGRRLTYRVVVNRPLPRKK